jgi:hypothetical protein
VCLVVGVIALAAQVGDNNAVYGRNITNYPRVLCQSGAGPSVTGSASETNLATCTIPAGVMNANGRLLIESLWKFVGTAGTKNPIIKLDTNSGGTAGTAYATAASGTASLSQRNYTGIWNLNSVSSQAGMAVSQTGFGPNNSTVVTSSVNTATVAYLNFNCQLANTGDTCVLVGYSVELINP